MAFSGCWTCTKMFKNKKGHSKQSVIPRISPIDTLPPCTSLDALPQPKLRTSKVDVERSTEHAAQLRSLFILQIEGSGAWGVVLCLKNVLRLGRDWASHHWGSECLANPSLEVRHLAIVAALGETHDKFGSSFFIICST